MSLIPVFEIGLWNAWILVIPMLIIFFFDVRVTTARESGESGDFQLTKKEKRIINAIFLPYDRFFRLCRFLASAVRYNMANQWSGYLSVWGGFHYFCSSEFRYQSQGQGHH